MSRQTNAPSITLLATTGRFADTRAAALVVVIVAIIYAARLTAQPLVGEETRWATAAREMLATGDWLVPRQQGQVFAERPPMTIWLMAITGYFRGTVDPIAVRLPSIIAVVLTALLVFAYARVFASRNAAIASAFVYATFGQVVMIGRLGESEAAFALFVSASLLIWHWGYAHGWRPLVVWSLGFALAALAALVKGPQAPAYFGAITATYLLLRRDWRYFLSWQAAVGGVVFLAIIAAWQIPFHRATDWQTVLNVWAGLAGDRIHLRGVVEHSISYPAETFACLLPWSPVLLALARRDVRTLLFPSLPPGESRGEGALASSDNSVVSLRSVTTFLITALLVAYPTVWLAAGARGRYFMPLYPLAAVLIGITIERCGTAPRGTVPRYAWHQFLVVSAIVIAGCGLVMASSLVLPSGIARIFNQPPAFAVAFALAAILAVVVLRSAWRYTAHTAPTSAVMAITAIVALGGTGIVINMHIADWNDPTDEIHALANHIPPGTRIVSLTAIDHRFAYFYPGDIDEVPWPTTVSELPAGVDYFCFMRHVTDTADARLAGRGRTSYTTPGTLPFAWKELAAICTDRQANTPTATSVVLGRVIRPLRAELSDATKPQSTTLAQQPNPARK